MNPRELDVLNILYQTEEPMMVTDIVKAGEGLTQSTVTAVLRTLLKKELVEVTGVTYSGKVLSRTYRPTQMSKDAIMAHFVEQYKHFHSIITPEELLEAIGTSTSLLDN